MSNTEANSLEECESLLDILLSAGATYADMKLYMERGSQVALRATSSDIQSFDRSVGVARVIYGRAWGIHVIEKPSKSLIKDACRSALKLAKASDSTSILDKPIRLAQMKPVRREVKHECSIDPLSVEVEQKSSLTRDLAESTESALKDSFGWCEVVYGDIWSDFSLISSEGTHIHEVTPSVDLLLYVTARSGDIVEGASKFVGYTKGYEAIEAIEREDLVAEVAGRARKLASAKTVQADLQGKRCTVVMSSECTGAFIHEAVGHPAEADFMLEAGSIFENKLGVQVAHRDLTIIDDAGMEGQYGSYSYDDEGVEARRIPVIERGILRSLLHTRETAAELNAEPTGNAHGLTHVPRCLMSNIYLEPGDWRREELIEETRNGLYIEGVVRAQSTPTEGLFMIQPESATIVRKGQSQETIRGVRITGTAQEALGSIDGIGNRLTMRATVEKEFNMADGGPPMRVSSLRIQ